eukprot:scaffold13057_cov111-Isochrysis_galbana.AAC.3
MSLRARRPLSRAGAECRRACRAASRSLSPINNATLQPTDTAKTIVQCHLAAARFDCKLAESGDAKVQRVRVIAPRPCVVRAHIDEKNAIRYTQSSGHSLQEEERLSTFGSASLHDICLLSVSLSRHTAPPKTSEGPPAVPLTSPPVSLLRVTLMHKV